jgi:hypothetical protein
MTYGYNLEDEDMDDLVGNLLLTISYHFRSIAMDSESLRRRSQEQQRQQRSRLLDGLPLINGHAGASSN